MFVTPSVERLDLGVICASGGLHPRVLVARCVHYNASADVWHLLPGYIWRTSARELYVHDEEG